MQAALPAVNIYRHLQARAADMMPRLAAHEACDLLWAFARAGLYAPQLLDQFVLHHAASGSCRAGLTPAAASKLLWAQATMGLSYPAITDAAIDVVWHAAASQRADAAHTVRSGASMHTEGAGLETLGAAIDSTQKSTPAQTPSSRLTMGNAAMVLHSVASTALVHGADIDSDMFTVRLRAKWHHMSGIRSYQRCQLDFACHSVACTRIIHIASNVPNSSCSHVEQFSAAKKISVQV